MPDARPNPVDLDPPRMGQPPFGQPSSRGHHRSTTERAPLTNPPGAAHADPAGSPSVPEAAVVEAYGGRVAYLPYVPDRSTTLIIQRIRSLSEPA